MGISLLVVNNRNCKFIIGVIPSVQPNHYLTMVYKAIFVLLFYILHLFLSPSHMYLIVLHLCLLYIVEPVFIISIPSVMIVEHYDSYFSVHTIIWQLYLYLFYCGRTCKGTLWIWLVMLKTIDGS